MTKIKSQNFVFQDLAIIFFSIILAVILIKTNAISVVLEGAHGLKVLGTFVAGMFFTSVFTTAPAIVTLGEIGSHNSIFLTALIGATGALVGDLIIFSFVRDKLSEHLTTLMEHTTYWRRVKHILKLSYFRWGTFLLGGLIIASPFPDELGISLMGFSKMKTITFIPISFFFNFIGIVLICLVARSI